MTESDLDLEVMAGILRKAGWGVRPPDQFVSDLDDEFLTVWGKIRDYTMISIERAWSFAYAVRHVSRNNVSGDIVECGVWKGGACLLASHILYQAEDFHRLIWLYDTFEGMPSPGEEDRIAFTGQSLSERGAEGWWAAALDEVKKNLAESPYPESRFRFVPGRVEETLDQDVPERIAVLRLDTDWYESTLKELEVLYPRVASGGVLIVDDYGHFAGARRAVDDFFVRRGERPFLHRSDYTGRVLVKI